jgi:Pyruvate/2-oxoacid:ferredoxin oxidoreductase delta subunit
MRHGKVSEGLGANLSQLRYVILAVIIIISFIVGSEFFITSYGRAAADSISVPFCQVCPIKPLFVLTQTELGMMSESVTYAWYGIGVWEGFYGTSINIFTLTLFLISAFAIRRVWCRICPAGGAMGMLNRIWFLRLDKDETRCTKCGICKRVCPLDVTEVYDKKGGDVTSTNCMLCLRCVEMCPYEGALKATFLGNVIYKSKNWLRGKFV